MLVGTSQDSGHRVFGHYLFVEHELHHAHGGHAVVHDDDMTAHDPG
jgi:hypothetical protein